MARAISLRAASSLTRRILVLNLGGLVALLIGFLYLNQFREGLIEARVQSLLTQGEIIAGAIASSATVEIDTITIDPDKLLQLQAGESAGIAEDPLDFSINPEKVAPLLRRLVTPTKTRARVYDKDGMEDAAPRADIFVTATGNLDVITVEHMRAMKHRAIVCNIGHFDSEIQVAGLKNFKWDNVKPQVDEIEFPDGKRIILLSEGRLVNLGNATGHPSFVMSCSFSNQTLAQIELWNHHAKYENKVYTLPKHLDEKVAALHLAKVGAKLTVLNDAQAKYLGLPVSGPFKPELYRY